MSEVLQVIFEFSFRSDRTYSNRGITFTKWEWMEKNVKKILPKKHHIDETGRSVHRIRTSFMSCSKVMWKILKKISCFVPSFALASGAVFLAGSDILNDFVVTYISHQRRENIQQICCHYFLLSLTASFLTLVVLIKHRANMICRAMIVKQSKNDTKISRWNSLPHRGSRLLRYQKSYY